MGDIRSRLGILLGIVLQDRRLEQAVTEARSGFFAGQSALLGLGLVFAAEGISSICLALHCERDGKECEGLNRLWRGFNLTECWILPSIFRINLAVKNLQASIRPPDQAIWFPKIDTFTRMDSSNCLFIYYLLSAAE